jgi:glycosyltransferase involved in cell wall biosynthesis
MKVLYIGNYRDISGWGSVAESNILAMNSVGIDVVARPVSFGPQKPVNSIIEAMEAKPCAGADICIQHCLPKHYYYNSKIKNIGFYCVESFDFYYSKWHKYINMMDRAWVMCDQNREASIRSGVSIPIDVVHYSIDPNKYDANKKTAKISELDNTFNFCFVGEWNNRKDLSSLLRAFYTEFHPSEPVNLFIKLSSNMDSDKCMNEFNKLNDYIKSGLKVRKKYQNISVVCGHMKHEDYVSILNQCHSFVCSSHGEACCIPALEAQALGLNLIYTNETGVASYAGENSCGVASNIDDCFGMQQSLPEIQSSAETWSNIHISSLRWTMRSVYENRNYINDNKDKFSAQIKDKFSHKAVGKIILEKLNGLN